MLCQSVAIQLWGMEACPSVNSHLSTALSSCTPVFYACAVEFKGESKTFNAEEISSMILAKMRDIAEVSGVSGGLFLCT